MPRKIWNRNTNAVAAIAWTLLPIDSKMETMAKHMQSPAAEVMSETLRPNLSMLQSGMMDPNRYAMLVPPPRIRDMFRESCMVLS